MASWHRVDTPWILVVCKELNNSTDCSSELGDGQGWSNQELIAFVQSLYFVSMYLSVYIYRTSFSIMQMQM